MIKMLSKIFLEKKRFEAYTPILRNDVLILEDIKTYGEIMVLEAHLEFAKYDLDKEFIKKKLIEIAQREGIKDYKI